MVTDVTGSGIMKIEIKKIEEANSRQVTFSKRRSGLFKKASELCVLTGAQVAILVNSPGGRVFAFGHPNADVLVDRYLYNYNNKNKKMNETTAAITGAVTEANYYSPPPHLLTKEFNQHYVVVPRELEAEKRRREMIPISSRAGLPWYDEPIDRLDAEKLDQYLLSRVELKKKVVTRADELMMIQKSFLGGPKVHV